MASTEQGKDQWQARAGGEGGGGGGGEGSESAAGGLYREAAVAAARAVASAQLFWLAAVHAPSIRHSVVPMVGPLVHAVLDVDASHIRHGTPSLVAT